MIKRFFGFLAILLSFSLFASCNQTDSSSAYFDSSIDTVSEIFSEANSSVTESSEGDSVESSSDEISSIDDTSSAFEEETLLYERQELKKGYMYTPAKILCFGDSFTSGSGTDGGYRYYLFEKLYSVGAKFEFVGQYQHNYYNLPQAYTYHLAVGGKKTDDAVSMYTGYVDKYGNDYDIILCMFGINDCYAGRTVTEILGYYEQLLNTIYEDNEDAVIYIASLPNVEESFADFNANIEAFCINYATSTEKEVYFVDMNGKYTLNPSTDCLAKDDVHPNNSGNKKIAYSWYDAIVNKVLEINDNVVKGTSDEVEAESISLSVTEATIALNERLSLNFEVLPEETTVKTVLWNSSDTNIAAVDHYGIVTPKSVGTSVITVKTLDGDYTAKCTVTVVESKEMITDSYTNEVFDSKFTTTEMWTGDIDMIKTDLGYAMTAWVGDAKTITTSKEIDFDDNFMLTMSYNVLGGEGATTDNKYSAVEFGNLKLVISRCAGKVELFHKDVSVGSYQYHSISNRFEDYALVYNKGNVTVIRGGEVLFTAQTDSESIKSTLSYTWNVSWNKATCGYIKVYKIK